jgi:hypothetical protein
MLSLVVIEWKVIPSAIASSVFMGNHTSHLWLAHLYTVRPGGGAMERWIKVRWLFCRLAVPPGIRPWRRMEEILSALVAWHKIGGSVVSWMRW